MNKKKYVLYMMSFLIGIGIGYGIDYKYEQIRYNTIKTLTEMKVLKLMNDKQYEEAIVGTGALFALKNDDVEFHLYLGEIYEHIRETNLALEEYNIVINFSKVPNEYKERAMERIKILTKSLGGHTITAGTNPSP